VGTCDISLHIIKRHTRIYIYHYDYIILIYCCIPIHHLISLISSSHYYLITSLHRTGTVTVASVTYCPPAGAVVPLVPLAPSAAAAVLEALGAALSPRAQTHCASLGTLFIWWCV
jgi:hypothetical protein